jgi:hypothetical protein
MSDLNGWATETINSLAKLNGAELRAALVRMLDGASQAERQALHNNIEKSAYQETKRVAVLKDMRGGPSTSPNKILEQEQRARRWAMMLEIARSYVSS